MYFEAESHYRTLNVLNVSVEQRNENNDVVMNLSKREFSYTSWVRSFTLQESADADDIEATYADGILKIAMRNVRKQEFYVVRSRSNNQ